MRSLIILSSLLAVAIARATSNICDGVTVKGVYYDKILLKTGLDRPFLLAVDHETDTLYFNYNINEYEYKSARLNLRTNEFKDIEGIPHGFSHAVDVENHLLYVGTTDGIYSYDLNTEETKFLGAKGHFIWTLFLKNDNLFYSTYPTEELYLFSNGNSTKYKDMGHTQVHYFVIDDDDDVFFSNDTGLFKHVKGTTDAVLYRNFDLWDIRALTLDLYGNIYAGIVNGVYAVKRHEVRLEMVLPVETLFGLAFDSDNNIIYSNDYNVVQLKPNKDKNC